MVGGGCPQYWRPSSTPPPQFGEIYILPGILVSSLFILHVHTLSHTHTLSSQITLKIYLLFFRSHIQPAAATFAQQSSDSQYFFCVISANDLHKVTPSLGQVHPRAPFASPTGIKPPFPPEGMPKMQVNNIIKNNNNNNIITK